MQICVKYNANYNNHVNKQGYQSHENLFFNISLLICTMRKKQFKRVKKKMILNNILIK